MRNKPLHKRLRHRLYYDLEWHRRLSTYSKRVTISEYARTWTRRRWGIDCEVVYPPVDVDMPARPKERLVLSVGRFSTAAHTKKQLEQMYAFHAFHSACPTWTYASVGGLNSREENQAFFNRVREAAVGHPACVEANISRATLKELFARASIYWHATGLNDDTDSRPELAEHFGISTVEAMAAGCVPVVINKGGQAEIVEHGVNGYRWNTVDELVEYSRRLAVDDQLRVRMSKAARERAQMFARSRFYDALSAIAGIRVQQ